MILHELWGRRGRREKEEKGKRVHPRVGVTIFIEWCFKVSEKIIFGKRTAEINEARHLTIWLGVVGVD